MEKNSTVLFLKGLCRLGFLLLTLSISGIFYSCTTSEEPVVDVDRVKDSTDIYIKLEKSFAHYQAALRHNQNANDAGAKDSFEDALKTLKSVDKKVLTAPGNFAWKKDYEELSTSVVQDYLTTQANISETSIVFSFAKELSVIYEKIKEMEDSGDREPLPNGTEVPLVRNEVVDQFIEFWTNTDRGKAFIDKTLFRSGKYFPIMRKILRYHNAPEELIYLSVQESGLNSTIVSRSGAVGLWQFMPATGSAYGLYQDGYRDDRRDFEKSTDAAARHLKDLYRTYNDWYLSFAAYNAGPGRVNSAIRKSGSRDFWTIRGYLPNETRDYVPYILALSFVFRDPEAYGFKDVEYSKPLQFDKVNIQADLTFERIAELSGTDIETIRELNPELLSETLPAYDVPYQLRIPYGSYSTFASNLKKGGMNEPEFAGNEKFGFGQVAAVTFKVSGYTPSDKRKIGISNDITKVSHTVKTDEQLSSIALSYSVRPTDIRMWNTLSYGKYPQANQKLTIYLSEESYRIKYGSKDGINSDFTRVVNENDVNKTQENLNKGITSFKKETTETTPPVTNTKPPVTNTTKTTNTPTGNAQVYVVKEGDYLSTIAGAYGVSVSNIQQWNGLESDVIKSGQKLKIFSDKKVTNTTTTKTKGTTHVVSEGENLSTIANEYGVSVDDLQEWNNIDNDVIKVGQKLIVSSSGTTTTKVKTNTEKVYVVEKGDMLSDIASNHGVSVKQLMDWNDLDDDVIKVGQKLKLYDDKKGNTNTKKTTTNTKNKDTGNKTTTKTTKTRKRK